MITLLTVFGIFALTVLSINSGVFLLATALRNNSIMDIAYGPAYAAATIVLITVTNTYSITALLLSGMVGLWSARLGIRILRKNFGQPEDARYANWRRQWQERGNLYTIIRSYLQVFVLQSLVISLVAMPIIVVVAHPLAFNLPLLLVGMTVSFCGLAIETIADWQLDSFVARKQAGTETHNVLTTGLFSYSRRPNYFGETLVWWGLSIVALPHALGYVALVSPLLITYIVTKVTGPMLEKIFIEKYGNEFAAYQKQTSYFIPLPPKR